MAKMNRERAVKERRARKQEKKDARKEAAAREAEGPDTTDLTMTVDDWPPAG